MIKIANRQPEPTALRSNKVEQLKRKIAAKIAAGLKVASDEYTSYWHDDTIRKSLWESQQKKCCYCERKRELKRESDVEHFRPKAAITEDPSHPGYWWLAYDWTNYLYACKPCNEAHKKNHFPLLTGGIRAMGPADNLNAEKPALINPIDDNPEESIGFVWKGSGNKFVKVVGLDKRGEITKDLTQLNRPELVEERAEQLFTLDTLARAMKIAENAGDREIINKFADRIRDKTKSNNSFAGFNRFFFHAQLLSEYVSTD